MKDYSSLDKLLHRIALGNTFVQRAAYEIDRLSSDSSAERLAQQPVYIAGLARAGTTILLKAIYSTGNFTSLTYRNMPFPAAPITWTRLSAKHRHAGMVRERAHGDRIHVGFDSPEAFEEPFWIMLTKRRYIHPDGLSTHSVDKNNLSAYRAYVSNILSVSPSQDTRYLAKNNNNILRITSLLQAFPDATILVPFRNPVDHARSLLRQHEQFTRIHEKDHFALLYMNWLGHFEFGANMKPFKLDDAFLLDRDDSAGTIGYWIDYWTYVYEYLLSNHVNDVIFFDYDVFCANPKRTLVQLSELLDIRPSQLTRFADDIRLPVKSTHADIESDLPTKAAAVYSLLQRHSLQAVLPETASRQI